MPGTRTKVNSSRRTDGVSRQSDWSRRGLINLSGFIEESLANGPGGPRAVVWTQGCEHACPGCQNPETWDRKKVGELISPEKLSDKILANPVHKGVTYSGGEPFLQARQLAKVSRLIRHARGLTTVVYSGFTYEELTGPGAPQGAHELLENTDLLIDGRYVESLKSKDPEAHLWRGSSNQRLFWLRPEFMNAERSFAGNVTEVHILPDGTVVFTGFGGQGFSL